MNRLQLSLRFAFICPPSSPQKLILVHSTGVNPIQGAWWPTPWPFVPQLLNEELQQALVALGTEYQMQVSCFNTSGYHTHGPFKAYCPDHTIMQVACSF